MMAATSPGALLPSENDRFRTAVEHLQLVPRDLHRAESVISRETVGVQPIPENEPVNGEDHV